MKHPMGDKCPKCGKKRTEDGGGFFFGNRCLGSEESSSVFDLGDKIKKRTSLNWSDCYHLAIYIYYKNPKILYCILDIKE